MISAGKSDMTRGPPHLRCGGPLRVRVTEHALVGSGGMDALRASRRRRFVGFASRLCQKFTRSEPWGESFAKVISVVQTTPPEQAKCVVK